MKFWCGLMSVILVGVAMCVGARAQAPEPRPVSTMQQLMQAIVFTNANVIFAAERDDPATIARDARPSLSTNPPSGLYGGWQAVENSGLALADAAELLNARNRVCSNGRAVPIDDARWKAAVAALRDAGIKVAAAARARSQDGMSAVSEQLINSCSSCHQAYRMRDNPCVAAR